MKNDFKNIILTIMLIVMLCKCSSYKRTFYAGDGGIERGRMNAITDFVFTYKTPRYYLKERKGKPFNVFWISNQVHDQYIFAIFPYSQGYLSLKVQDSLGKVPVSNFPNNYIIKGEKLFLWKDSLTPLNKEILNVIKKYGILDSTDVKKKLGVLSDDFEDTRMVIIDHRDKGGWHYYVCKKNIEKFKKVKTNIAIGYYQPPILTCK